MIERQDLDTNSECSNIYFQFTAMIVSMAFIAKSNYVFSACRSAFAQENNVMTLCLFTVFSADHTGVAVSFFALFLNLLMAGVSFKEQCH